MYKKIKGGIKKNKINLTSWNAVYKMITSDSTRLTCLSYDSLKGYLIQAEFVDDNVEFLSLNESRTAFTKPVNYVALKFTLIGEGIKLEPLIIGVGSFIKETEKELDYLEEANKQQKIYIKSVTTNGNAICPGVLDFLTFDSTNAKILLKKIFKKAKDLQSKIMIQYLFSELVRKHSLRLGLITMELVDNCRTLQSIKLYQPAYDNGRKQALAQLLRLFLNIKIINYDCHLKNVLTRLDESSSANGDETVLIDFGRTLDFSQIKLSSDNISKERCFSQPAPSKTHELITKYNAAVNPDTGTPIETENNYLSDLNNIIGLTETDLIKSKRVTEDIVIVRMSNIIKFIALVDYCCKYVVLGECGRPQMIHLLEYIYGKLSDNWIHDPPNFELTPVVKAKYREIIPVFEHLTTNRRHGDRNAISAAAIERMIADGTIFSVNSLKYRHDTRKSTRKRARNSSHNSSSNSTRNSSRNSSSNSTRKRARNSSSNSSS